MSYKTDMEANMRKNYWEQIAKKKKKKILICTTLFKDFTQHNTAVFSSATGVHSLLKYFL